MHCMLIVVLPPDITSIDDALEEAMKPFYCNYDAIWEWDWYQIGGRFTGIFDKWDPKEDPNNWDLDLNDLKWPTQWTRYEGDITTPDKVIKAMEMYPDGMGFIFLAGETTFARLEWDGNNFIKNPDFDEKVKKALNVVDPKSYVVCVDIHS